MSDLLRTEGLTRRFGGLTALSGVDFRLAPGEVRALIGPNGAGKSTFVGLVTGRIRPSAGRILLEGRDVTALPAHRRMRMGLAYTFQITSVFPSLTVFDNVALAAQARPGAEAGRLADEVAAALARVGLADRAGSAAADLSYGHQRLLEIAMGLAQQPRLLILDEPTQGLAEGEIAAFVALIRDVARSATVLLIEHNMAVVMALATRITVLEFGQVLAEGSPAEIRADPSVQRAYLGG